ncbi:MAG: hypothetical protein D6788_07590 [Planctomycetota bacterium]|nr:MAG: hypothetical protein D6788_07590 [Planctomycetota bacterium]
MKPQPRRTNLTGQRTKPPSSLRSLAMNGKRNRARQRRGTVAVQLVVALPVLLSLAAITVDVGTLYNTRNDLQRTADAAALSAIGVLAYAGPGVDPVPAARETALDYVRRNHVMGQGVTADPRQDVVFGRAVLDEATGNYVFTPAAAPVNAVRVTVRKTEDSPNGPAPLFFAHVFGRQFSNVSASSTAMVVSTSYVQSDCWDLVPPGQTLICLPGAGGDAGDSDSESDDSGFGTDTTVMIYESALPFFLSQGATVGACECVVGDADDSDDSENNDSGDSDDSDGDGPGTTNNGVPKVQICHVPPGDPSNAHTIVVGQPAVNDHLDHGDTIGACSFGAGSVRIMLIQ